MALNNMLSPSEIVRRIERARLPTSKSSYNQFSAFQMAISRCFAGSGFGFFTGFLFVVRRFGVLQLVVCVAVIHPSDQTFVVHFSTQAAIELDTHGFEETNKAVEAGAHIGCLQG